jgi:hypothetical protein
MKHQRTKEGNMNKFKVEIEVEIPTDLAQYVNRQTPASTSMLVGLAKDVLTHDVADAIRLYGIQGHVTYVAKAQS